MLKLYINIKNERIKNGWNQTELALKVGYSDKSMIAKIEAGKIDLPQTKIRAFAQAFNVTESYLMGWEEVSDPSTAALENIINTNKEKGGSSKLAEQLYNDTVVNPAAKRMQNNIMVLSESEIALIEKYRNATPEVKHAIATLLAFAIEQENKNNDNR